MTRFSVQKKSYQPAKILLSVGVFLIVLSVFVQGITSLSEGTRKRQKESLENAVMRDVTYCYTVEGAYPESLEYLEEHYGLTYDEDLFFVDYRISGANIFPDITVIEKK